MQQAQKYMEEIQVMDSIDTLKYPYDSECGAYERKIQESANNFSAVIKLKPDSRNMLHSIEIVLKKDDQVINRLVGNKIFNLNGF